MTRRVYQAVLICALVVFTLLFAKEVSSANKVIQFEHLDKVAHFGIFFILAFVSHHALKLPVWLHIVLLSFYGAAVEWMQSTIPHRSASLGDFIADVLGVLSYFLLFFGWTALKNRRVHE